MICIGGPTASGKTALAIALAQHYKTEIISFDSRQIYRELDIGVARPEPAQLTAVRHHMIGITSVRDHYTVGDYVEQATATVRALSAKYEQVVAVGGTGFYLDSLIHPLDEIPGISDEVRHQTAEYLDTHTLEEVRRRVVEIDPELAAKMDTANLSRLRRVLEVYLQTGRAMSSFYTGEAKASFPGMQVTKFALLPPRAWLYERINRRVEEMIVAGLEEEVRNLLEYRHLKSLNTVGYKELFAHFDGSVGRPEAIEKIKQHSRNYAKRQYTWFHNQGNWIPVAAQSTTEQLTYILNLLNDLEK